MSKCIDHCLHRHETHGHKDKYLFCCHEECKSFFLIPTGEPITFDHMPENPHWRKTGMRVEVDHRRSPWS